MSLFLFFLLLPLSLCNNSSQLTSNTTGNYTDFLNDPFLKLISYSESVVEAQMGIQLRQLTSLFIGTPYQKIKAKLSTAICGLWVVSQEAFGHGFKYTESDTYTDLGMPGKVDYTRGEMSAEVIQFCNLVPANKVNFLLVNEVVGGTIETDTGGLIGFGYKCRSKSIGNLNLVKVLIENNSTQYTDMFVFTFDNVKNGGQFTIGIEPSGIDRFSKKHWIANVNQNNDNGHWLIKFKSIFFDDNTLIPIDAQISI